MPLVLLDNICSILLDKFLAYYLMMKVLKYFNVLACIIFIIAALYS